jgi:hypothetical protein
LFSTGFTHLCDNMYVVEISTRLRGVSLYGTVVSTDRLSSTTGDEPGSVGIDR